MLHAQPINCYRKFPSAQSYKAMQIYFGLEFHRLPIFVNVYIFNFSVWSYYELVMNTHSAKRKDILCVLLASSGLFQSHVWFGKFSNLDHFGKFEIIPNYSEWFWQQFLGRKGFRNQLKLSKYLAWALEMQIWVYWIK